jgi:hypothetical protein
LFRDIENHFGRSPDSGVQHRLSRSPVCASYNAVPVDAIEAWLARTLACGRVGVLPAEAGGRDAIMEVARRHRVDVLLADLIVRASDDNGPWAFERESLNAMVRLAAAREISDARDVSPIFSDAYGNRIDLLLLKGTALAYSHYPQPHLRPRNDIDLYVRHADLDRAEAVLVSRGFSRAQEANAELWTGQRHYARTTPFGEIHIDLHWRVVNPLVFADVLTFDDVWPRAVSVPALGMSVRALSSPDALLVACLHRVAHHQDRENLLWLWDIHLIASRLSAAEWSLALDTAASSRVRSVCARGLSLASECFGTVFPEQIRDSNRAATGEPGAAFLRDGLRQVDVARADLAALTTWREKFALVREHVCPPIAYMRARYAKCPPALIPLAYLHRIVRGAPKWFER